VSAAVSRVLANSESRPAVAVTIRLPVSTFAVGIGGLPSSAGGRKPANFVDGGSPSG